MFDICRNQPEIKLQPEDPNSRSGYSSGGRAAGTINPLIPGLVVRSQAPPWIKHRTQPWSLTP